MCHEARNWVYRGTQQWCDALDGMLEFRRHQHRKQQLEASGSSRHVPMTDKQRQRQLSSVAKCSRILSLQEFIRYDEILREHVCAMDARKREERRMKREQQQLRRQQRQQEEALSLMQQQQQQQQYEEREEQAETTTAPVVAANDVAAAVDAEVVAVVAEEEGM